MAASKYHLRATSDDISYLFALDATTKATFNKSGEISKFPLLSGNEASDNYVNKPDTVAFEGYISDLKAIGSVYNGAGNKAYVDTDSGRALKDTGDWISQLTKLKDERTLFYVSFGELGGTNNWMIKSLDIMQDSKNGNSFGANGKVNSSYKIAIVLEQIRLSSVIQTREVRDPIVQAEVKSEPIKKVKAVKKPVKIYTYGPAGFNSVDFGTRDAEEEVIEGEIN